jgi:hypothetical protein
MDEITSHSQPHPQVEEDTLESYTSSDDGEYDSEYVQIFE